MNKIVCMEMGDRDKALDTFVRGLKGDLPRLLGIREPADLPQVLHLCLKLENQNFRSNYAFNTQSVTRKFSNHSPQLPVKKSNPSFVRQTFYPQLAHMPQPQTNFPPWKQTPRPFNTYNTFHQPQFAPPRPFGAKPLPKPEPMDIDQSMRTKNLNYMNRPRPNDMTGKRPHPNQFQESRKIQRNFHIDNQLQEQEMYQPAFPDSDAYATLENYTLENSDVNTELLDTSDIHF